MLYSIVIIVAIIEYLLFARIGPVVIYILLLSSQSSFKGRQYCFYCTDEEIEAKDILAWV